MYDVKKVITHIIGILIIIAISFGGGYFTKQRLNSVSIAEYTNTIREYESRYTTLSESYNRLRESNTTLTDRNTILIGQLTTAKGRADKAEGIIGEISIGLSKTSGDIQSIIDALSDVIEAIRRYRNVE